MGPTGPIGVAGLTGPIGLEGPAGTAENTGATGNIGPTGPGGLFLTENFIVALTPDGNIAYSYDGKEWNMANTGNGILTALGQSHGME
jgi:hypothetical protein